MGRINVRNAGKVGIIGVTRSLFGLDRVLILDGFEAQSNSLTMPPIPPEYSDWQTTA